MIRYGPAGIPLSCKGRTLKDGVIDVHNLGLSALEVQMLRPTTIQRYPEDYEYLPQGLGGEPDYDAPHMSVSEMMETERLVLEVYRDAESIGFDEPLEEEDILVELAYPLAKSHAELREVRRIAELCDVALSIHTPYYMDMSSNNQFTEKSMDCIRHSAIVAELLNANIVTTNMGLYKGGVPTDENKEAIINNLGDVMDWWTSMDIQSKLGVEFTGQQCSYGSLEDVFEICDIMSDNFGKNKVVPVMNFPHYQSRYNGILSDSEAFIDLIGQVSSFYSKKDPLHASFSGVEYVAYMDTDGEYISNERRLTPIKKGDLKFEPLGEALMELKPDMTIISSSPLLEHDAVYMKVIGERVLTKRVMKQMKEERKKEEEERKAAETKAQAPLSEDDE